MKSLSLKCSVVFIILLFPLEINNDHLSHIKDKISEFTNNQLIVKGLQKMNDLNLEVKSADSRPINHGEKVETTVVPGPLLNYSEASHINLYNLRATIFSKKQSCLVSHYYFLASKTFQISPLVNILRI